MSLKFTSAFAFAALVLSACGTESKIGQTFDLQGSYHSEPSKGIGPATAGPGCKVTTMTMTGASMTFNQGFYDRTDCTGRLLGELRYEGTAFVGNVINGDPTFHEINYTINRIVLTPHTADWATFFGFDQSGSCNLKNVALGTEFEAAGLKCGTFGDFPAKGQIYYASYRNQGNNVLFSKLPNEVVGHVGQDGQAVPRDVDAVVNFIKQ